MFLFTLGDKTKGRLLDGERCGVRRGTPDTATANAHDKKGPAAVIHYTHTPCGYIDIGGTVYR